METLAEVDESKETSPIGPSGSPGPPFAQNLSSSASPKSIQVNRSHINDQPCHQNDETNTIDSDRNSAQTNHSINDKNDSSSNNTNNTCNNFLDNSLVDNIAVVNSIEISIGNNGKPLSLNDDEYETPLLEAENSTNVNYSTDSEKDALIITANN